MTRPNILTDTTPRRSVEDPTVATCVITDAWGLYFAQGGVVMAAALRAMALILNRSDLTLASASGTFCRPVPCGPVATSVEVLRNGRSGAQVRGSLRDEGTAPGDASVDVTAVFTNPDLSGPTRTPVPRPPELMTPPAEDLQSEAVAAASDFPFGFLDNTEWHTAASPRTTPSVSDPLPRIALWFRFTDPPAAPGAPWEPALLPIPGDSLGSALSVALAGGQAPVGSVSLQIGVQVLAPITGTWIAIDSTCTHIGNGLATGVLHLWSESGAHVATVTQTAMLKSFSSQPSADVATSA
jgi:acyl-CoA thioesterase